MSSTCAKPQYLIGSQCTLTSFLISRVCNLKCNQKLEKTAKFLLTDWKTQFDEVDEIAATIKATRLFSITIKPLMLFAFAVLLT